MNVDEYGRPIPAPTWGDRLFAIIFVIGFFAAFFVIGVSL